MKKKFFLILGLGVFVSCATVKVQRDPDFRYPPTNPSSVIIYDQMEPIRAYKEIGMIKIDDSLSISNKKGEKRVKRKAASIGGDAVIMTDKDLSWYITYAFGKTAGTASVWGTGVYHRVYYREPVNNNYFFVPRSKKYGYVIKFTGTTISDRRKK